MKVCNRLTYIGICLYGSALLAAGLPVPVAASSTASDIPEVTWFARWLGKIGLPTLLVIAGVLLGVVTAAIVIGVVRRRDRRRATMPTAEHGAPASDASASSEDDPE